METITSKCGNLSWNIERVGTKQEGKKRVTNRALFSASCTTCGYQLEKPKEKGGIKKLKICPGCAPKPTALKTDNEGNCITICRLGQLEHIHKLITADGMSEREAAQSFIESVQAHSPEGDPLTSTLTVEQIRSQFRRDSGRLHDKRREEPERVEPTQHSGDPEKTEANDNEINSSVDAIHIARTAITGLSKIPLHDPQYERALVLVIGWCKEQKRKSLH